jgi:transcription initiation factor TFIID subunit 15
MNRHHPYGSSFEGHRRGGSPSGPGPDRQHRFQERSGGGYRGRGGYGRGRGGGRSNPGADYGPYDGGSIHGGYDQVNDMEAYNEYDSQAPAPQRPFQQNAPYPSYNQGHGKYEGTLILETESASERAARAILSPCWRPKAHGEWHPMTLNGLR